MEFVAISKLKGLVIGYRGNQGRQLQEAPETYKTKSRFVPENVYTSGPAGHKF